jgi:hypothetical protein
MAGSDYARWTRTLTIELPRSTAIWPASVTSAFLLLLSRLINLHRLVTRPSLTPPQTLRRLCSSQPNTPSQISSSQYLNPLFSARLCICSIGACPYVTLGCACSTAQSMRSNLLQSKAWGSGAHKPPLGFEQLQERARIDFSRTVALRQTSCIRCWTRLVLGGDRRTSLISLVCRACHVKDRYGVRLR